MMISRLRTSPAVAVIGIVLSVETGAHAQALLGSAEGTIFGRPYATFAYNVNAVLQSRSGEPWYPTLSGAGLIFEPPRLHPKGITLHNGLVYVTGDWNETQNQIAVFR